VLGIKPFPPHGQSILRLERFVNHPNDAGL
jgi:hypothetical protein